MNTDFAPTILTIDTSAIVKNYEILKKQSSATKHAAVVKANAYGLGVEPLAKVLLKAGCDIFFVATVDEGIQLRQILSTATIYVFHGVSELDLSTFDEFNLVPVLNSLNQVLIWCEYEVKKIKQKAAIIHVDSGMNRLGMSINDLKKLNELYPDIKKQLAIHFIMTHPACADEHHNPMNQLQLKQLHEASKYFKDIRLSFSNSYATFLSSDYHCDLARFGVALYGVNPISGQNNPMKSVVNLKTRIIQIHSIDRDSTVGYGATYLAKAGSKIATIPVGYADGYLRSMGNKGFCAMNGIKIPIVGRVSMDLITLDVTEINDEWLFEGAEVELIGQTVTVDDVASYASTIGYEILTSLGHRYKRNYV